MQTGSSSLPVAYWGLSRAVTADMIYKTCHPVFRAGDPISFVRGNDMLGGAWHENRQHDSGSWIPLGQQLGDVIILASVESVDFRARGRPGNIERTRGSPQLISRKLSVGLYPSDDLMDFLWIYSAFTGNGTWLQPRGNRARVRKSAFRRVFPQPLYRKKGTNHCVELWKIVEYWQAP